MTTKEKIAEIIKNQYGDFMGRKMIAFGKIHSIMRKKIGDKEYLRFIERQQKINPRPVYKNSEL